MKSLLKIIGTNWIHLLGFYISTYFATIIFQLIGIHRYQGYSWSTTLFMNLAGILFLFFTYGLIFILAFYLLLILMDFIAFRYTKLPVIYIILIEWVLLSPPFIYWAFTEDYWLWLALVISLLGTQLVRLKWIAAIRNS
jgi:hypothetical protein